MSSLQGARVSLELWSQSRSEIRRGSSLRIVHRQLFACSLQGKDYHYYFNKYFILLFAFI